MDLLDLLKENLGFDYVIYEQATKDYGSKLEDGRWNGMVGDLMERDTEKVSALINTIALN